MSDDYTPRTVDVRAVYASGVFFQTSLTSFAVDAVRSAAEFDRWLVERDRQVAERAWAECIHAAAWTHDNGNGGVDFAYVAANNPYAPSTALQGVQEESKA